MLNQDEIAKLPTLWDIIKQCLDNEQRFENLINNSRYKGLFPTKEHKGYFEPMQLEDGSYILMPLSPNQFTMFRGESSFHEECYPTLFRKGMYDADVFVERIKRCELEFLMQDYPITNIFANTIEAQDPSGHWHNFKFRVGYDGMAQHYGIKTDCLDLTSDIWTAAFFASTKYDYKSDTYTPITDTIKYKYGVIYTYNFIPFPGQERVDVVGLQPLKRPGRQSGYVFRMKYGENFNNLASKQLFRHDSNINQLVYNYNEQSKRLFPKEILNDKIRNGIVNANFFSQKAFDEAKNRYFPKTDDKILQKYLITRDITINSASKQWFSESEKEDILDYWKSIETEFFNKIKPPRWTYTPNQTL